MSHELSGRTTLRRYSMDRNHVPCFVRVLLAGRGMAGLERNQMNRLRSIALAAVLFIAVALIDRASTLTPEQVLGLTIAGALSGVVLVIVLAYAILYDIVKVKRS